MDCVQISRLNNFRISKSLCILVFQSFSAANFDLFDRSLPIQRKYPEIAASFEPSATIKAY